MKKKIRNDNDNNDKRRNIDVKGERAGKRWRLSRSSFVSGRRGRKERER